jgi:hypothetical protein
VPSGAAARSSVRGLEHAAQSATGAPPRSSRHCSAAPASPENANAGAVSLSGDGGVASNDGAAGGAVSSR